MTQIGNDNRRRDRRQGGGVIRLNQTVILLIPLIVMIEVLINPKGRNIVKQTWLMSTMAGLLCVGFAACSKPAEKPATPVAPAPTTAPATTAPAAPAANGVAPTAPAAPAAAANNGPISRFKANGSSPAWEATIDGDSVTFEVPETTTPDGKKRTIKVERSAYAKGANYNGKDGNVPFSLDINGKECVKTGAKREFTATLAYGKSVYKGCADALK